MSSNSASHLATQQSIKAYVDSQILTKDNTDEITEGSSNLYFTNARARGAISVSGNALSYDSATGVITSNFEESPTFTGDITISSNIPAIKQ